MKKLVGYLLLGIGFLTFWPVQIGLGLYGLYYIIMAFINAGVVAGLISIPIVGISLAIIGFIIHILATPYMLLVSFLLQDKRGKVKWERELEEIWDNYDRQLATDDMNKRAEIEWRIHHWRRFMEDGLSPKEADKQTRALDYEVWKEMKYEES